MLLEGLNTQALVSESEQYSRCFAMHALRRREGRQLELHSGCCRFGTLVGGFFGLKTYVKNNPKQSVVRSLVVLWGLGLGVPM